MPSNLLSFTLFVKTAKAKTTNLEAKVVSVVIPLFACMILFTSPCFANDPSPFVVDGETGAAQALPKLSTAKDYFVRGLTEANNKDFANAVKDYTEAIRLNPHYGEALGNRGAARFNLQDYNGSLEDYSAALRIFPTNSALITSKAQVEGVLKENANRPSQAALEQEQARRRAQMMNVMMGGDFADPSTMIMRNAQQRGLVPNVGDPSDPATIIMNNARRRGLIPANTPNP